MKVPELAYMPADNARSMPNKVSIGHMQLAQQEQAQKLQGFVQYLQGFRGLGRPISQAKMAVVKTQSYTLLLGAPDGDMTKSVSLKCWVLQE